MKKKIKNLIILCGCACLLTVGGTFVNQSVEGKADSSLDLQTIYRLTLTDYQVQNYSTNVKAIDPNGEEAVLHRGVLSLDVAGTYTIDYGNNNLKHIVSLLRGTIEDMTFSENSEMNGFAGEIAILPIPTFVKTQGYQEAEAHYRVDVFKDGERIESLTRNEGQSASYFFNSSGDYTFTYYSVDEFGIEKMEKSFSFYVEDKEVVFFEKLGDTANYGDEVDIGFPYGFYKGVMYDAETEVTDPNGTTREWKASKYQFLQKGEYVFTYTSLVNEKKITASQKVVVGDNDTAFTFVSGAGSIEYGATLPENVNAYYGEHTTLSEDKTAVKITSSEASPKILYNKVIDLSKLSAEENLISFFPVSGADKDLSGLRIRLMDIYDPSKSVAVYVRKNPNSVTHSTALVEFNGVSGSLANDPKANLYGTLRSDATAAFIYYQSSLVPYTYEKVRMFTLRFNYEENALYAFSRNNQYKFVNQIMLDLDDSTKINYDKMFEGFTTGEVALTIELDRNVNAGIYVAEIAGQKVSRERDFTDLLINVETPQADIYDGAVNYRYELPSATVLSCIQSQERIRISLSKDGQDCSSMLNGNIFTPTQAGGYEVTYRYNYRGEELVKRLRITIKDSPNPIDVEIPTGERVEYGDTYYVPNLICSGGSGALSISHTARLNAKEILPTEKGGYFIDAGGILQISVVVEDEIGLKKEVSYEIAVEDGVILSLDSAVPTALRIGKEIVFPTFTATSVLGTTVKEEMNLRILVNETTVLTEEHTYVVPDVSLVKVEYQADTGDGFVTLETYEIPVYPEIVEKTESLFICNDGIGTQLLESSLLFTMQESGEPYEICMPNVVSTYNLAFSFIVHENTFNADAFTIFYTDVKNGNILKLRFFEINTANQQAKFTINGGKEAFVLKGTKITYSDQCGDAETAERYKGGTYVEFSIELNEAGEYFRNGKTKELVARFSSFENGSVFTGFSYATCKVKVQIEGVMAYTELGIANISNQQFNYNIAKFGFEDFDNVGPQINVYGNRELVEKDLGESYTVSTAKGYDVIQGSANVRVTITTESGKKLVNNLSATSSRVITLEERGYYTVEYVCYDSIGNKTTASFKIVVADNLAPTLMVDGRYQATYKIGDKVQILGFSANDNEGETVAYIYLQTPDTIVQVNANETITLDTKGKYSVIYRVEDEWLNVTRVVCEFEVR